jgi:hypothetical protein
MKVAPEIIAALCRKHAPDLFAPAQWQGTPLDKVRLLWGISGVESSFGLNCNPRHEPGYCFNGRYFDPDRTRMFGCLAHCSYGPWQVMFPHFPFGVSPLSLLWDADGRVAAETCLVGAVKVLNVAIAHGAKNLSDIVIAYNGPADEEEYSARLAEHLTIPMPETADVEAVSG